MAARLQKSSPSTTPDRRIAEEAFDQLYEEALGEAFAFRLNVLFGGSFDKAFEHHFNGVYNKIIKRNFDSVFDKISTRKSQMQGEDSSSSSSSSSTSDGSVKVELTTTSPKALKKDYQPHDIIRRKIRHGISRDICKEVLFRVREAVKKDLELEVRKSISREAFWDLLQESQSKSYQNDMSRTKLPAEGQQSKTKDDQNAPSRTTKLPAKRQQSKFSKALD